MLALLSVRMEVKIGRSTLKPSSASSPPPSWIHSRVKTVAAAACSSPPPAHMKGTVNMELLQSSSVNIVTIYTKNKHFNHDKSFLFSFCKIFTFQNTHLFVLPFLILLSKQSLTVRRLSVRKSYKTLEEKTCRSDSRAARRVFALRQKREGDTFR